MKIKGNNRNYGSVEIEITTDGLRGQLTEKEKRDVLGYPDKKPQKECSYGEIIEKLKQAIHNSKLKCDGRFGSWSSVYEMGYVERKIIDEIIGNICENRDLIK